MCLTDRSVNGSPNMKVVLVLYLKGCQVGKAAKHGTVAKARDFIVIFHVDNFWISGNIVFTVNFLEKIIQFVTNQISKWATIRSLKGPLFKMLVLECSFSLRSKISAGKI